MGYENSLLDLVKLEDIQRLIDFAWKATSIPGRLVNTQGAILYASPGILDWACSIQPFQRPGESPENCFASGEIECVGGLRQAWFPICVQKKVVAWIVLGAYVYEEETIRAAEIHELPEFAKLSIQEFDACLKEIARPNRLNLERFLEHYRWQSDFISTMAERTLEIRQQLDERVLTQNALTNLEKRYQDIFNGVQDGILVEAPDGAILDVNEPACRMHGYTREEFLNLYVPDLVAPGHAVIYLTPESTNANIPTESINRRKDGTTFPVELSGRKWEMDGQIVTLVVLRDISQRKQAERESRMARERLELGLDAAGAGLWDWDIPSGRNFVSQQWYTMLGYDASETPTRFENWQALVHPDDLIRVTSISDQYIAGLRSNYEVEFRLRGKDGSWYWIQSRGRVVQRSPDGKPLRMVGTHTDISVRKAAEAALRASEEKFYKSFQTSPDAISINSLSDFQYLDINDGFARLTGYSREEVIGKTIPEIKLWVDPDQYQQMMRELSRKQEVLGKEIYFRRKDGSTGTGLIAARTIELEGKPCFMGIIRDITDRKQAEDLLQDAHLRLKWAYEATLLGWNRALEMKDVATKRHSDRCIDQTIDLARAAGIDNEYELLMVKYGAILHDIGKLAIPDRILNKPGPLTSEEWALMRRHPLYAKEMLQGIEYLEAVIPLITNHHERWDGNGYPFGLEQDEIPLAARIFAIVDVYDSISHERPWRASQTEADALEYVRENAGFHFDPHLVDLFLEMIAHHKYEKRNTAPLK